MVSVRMFPPKVLDNDYFECELYHKLRIGITHFRTCLKLSKAIKSVKKSENIFNRLYYFIKNNEICNIEYFVLINNSTQNVFEFLESPFQFFS